MNKEKFVLESRNEGIQSKGILDVLGNHRRKLAASLGTISIISSMLLSGCSSQSRQERMTTESEITSIEEIIETKPEETKAFTTTSMEEATTGPVATKPEEQLEFTTGRQMETMPSTTLEPVTTTQNVNVTKAATTTVAETTVQTTTTTMTQTTTAPVTTTQAVEPAKPIKVSNLSEKVDSFKEELKKAGIIANDELIENAVRVINSDFIQHDGLCEITAQKHEHQSSLLTSLGSKNTVTFSAVYMGYIDKVEEGFYIPAEICPKQNRKFINAFTKLSESYRKSLNKLGMVGMVEITDEEYDEISESTMKELDKLNIQDISEYDRKYQEIYNKKIDKLFGEKQKEQDKAVAKREKEARKIYKEFYNDVMELVKSEEYEKLTPTEKFVVFINISGALTSGMTEKQKEQYMDFQKGIESSIDEAREQLVVANRKNINQQDALDTIVANNKEQVKQERNDLEAIGNAYEIMYYSGIQLVR